MTPQRIQRKRTKGWTLPPGAVIVDRTTEWGNPFAIRPAASHLGGSKDMWGVYLARTRTVHHPTRTGECLGRYDDRAVAVADSLCRYRLSIREADEGRTWQGYPTTSRIREVLAGKDLCCYCRLDSPCHADTLLAIANGDDR